MTTTDYYELTFARAGDSSYRLALQQYWFREGEEIPSSEAAIVPLGDDFTAKLLEHANDPKTASALILAGLGGIKAALEGALSSSLHHGRALRLRLIIEDDAPEVHRIPWELLLDALFAAMGAQRLHSAANHFYFSRYLKAGSKTPPSLRSRGELRYLVATANPHDLGAGMQPIDAETEAARFRKALGPQAAIATLAPTAEATLTRLAAALHSGAVTDVLCLVAHGAFKPPPVPSPLEEAGTYATLVLEDDGGKVLYRSAKALVDVVANAPRLPRVVILGSCESAGDTHGDLLLTLGPLLASRGVPAVVAMQGRVQHATFTAFLAAFLPVLAATGEADRAMAAARAALIDTHADWWRPVLFQRTRFGKIWLESDADRLKKATDWLRRNNVGPDKETREQLAHAILASPGAASLEWTELKTLDELLDELADSPGAAARLSADELLTRLASTTGEGVPLADHERTFAEIFPYEHIPFAAARALHAILRDVWLQSSRLHELYSWVKPRGDQWPLPVYDDRAGRLAAVVTPLAWAGPHHHTGLPPLTMLVDTLLRPEYENPSVKAVADKLRAWRSYVTPGVAVFGASTPAASARPYLQVVIRQARNLTGEPLFACHGWLRFEGATAPGLSQALGDAKAKYGPGELPAVFKAVISQGMQHLAGPEAMPEGTAGLRIEVFLPKSLLLALPVERWRIANETRRGIPVGVRHPVVVRAIERALPGGDTGARADWNAKWHHFDGRSQEPALGVLSWLPPPSEADLDVLDARLVRPEVIAVGQPWDTECDPDAPALYQALCRNPDSPELLAKLCALPEDLALCDVLDSVYAAGVPVALAVRLDGEPAAAARAALHAGLKLTTLAELPKALLAQRQSAVGEQNHLGGRLALLWDDPGRLPPTNTFTSGE